MFTKKNENEKNSELSSKIDQPKPSTEVSAKKQTDSKNESKQLSQKECVYLAVSKIVEQDKITLSAKPKMKETLSKEQLEKVHELVFKDLTTKKARLKDTESNQKKLSDSNVLRNYVRGMVQNWFRRDDRLNGTTNFR